MEYPWRVHSLLTLSEYDTGVNCGNISRLAHNCDKQKRRAANRRLYPMQKRRNVVTTVMPSYPNSVWSRMRLDGKCSPRSSAPRRARPRGDTRMHILNYQLAVSTRRHNVAIRQLSKSTVLATKWRHTVAWGEARNERNPRLTPPTYEPRRGGTRLNRSALAKCGILSHKRRK